jgi:glycosyltransferase involved in cell wall biosynthesis
VAPSLFEGFGLPAAEAMASGTAVVATDGGALPEVVADGETGVVVPARDAGALADAIDELIGDPVRCEVLGKAGRARVLERFTWERTARETSELYEDVLRRRGCAP